MKTNTKTGALGLCLALIAITSCEKEGVDLYEGFYSYKLSGTLTLDKQLIEKLTDEIYGEGNPC